MPGLEDEDEDEDEDEKPSTSYPVAFDEGDKVADKARDKVGVSDPFQLPATTAYCHCHRPAGAAAIDYPRAGI